MMLPRILVGDQRDSRLDSVPETLKRQLGGNG